MQAIQLLWVDDEIDLLKPHILFLQQKGYEVASLTNGYDALDYLQENPIDLVILDESMPGMTGLETLVKIKELFPYMPIVMATKNEAEYVMEDAIGNQISDYLIKPIHPNQVLISIKKIIDAGGKAILMSHLGRPKGERKPEFSLKPAADRLGKLLGKEVKIAHDCIGAETEKMVNEMKAGDVIEVEITGLGTLRNVVSLAA